MSESKLILCPYCGHTQQADSDRCEECRGLFEPLSRHATQIAMGPWFIRDKAHPFRPGCSYDVIVKQVAAGKIKSTTVMRGPTTRQFWSVARNVPGVAHLLGYCYRCGARVQPDGMSCRECFEQFHEPQERNELGLMYPTAGDAKVAQRALEKEIAALAGFGGTSDPTLPHVSAVQQGLAIRSIREEFNPMTRGADLLDEVVSEVKPRTREAKQRVAAKPPVQPPPTAPASSPEALNFEPTDEPDQPTNSDALRKRNIWIIVLLVVVVALLAAQIGLMMIWSGEHDRQPQPAGSYFPPAMQPQALPALPESPPPSPAPAPSPDQAAPPEPTSLFDTSTETTETEKPASRVEEITSPDDVPADLNTRLAEARKLENQKRYRESLEVLRDIERRTPNSRRPEELHQSIERVETALRRQNATRIFEDN